MRAKHFGRAMIVVAAAVTSFAACGDDDDDDDDSPVEEIEDTVESVVEKSRTPSRASSTTPPTIPKHRRRPATNDPRVDAGCYRRNKRSHAGKLSRLPSGPATTGEVQYA